MENLGLRAVVENFTGLDRGHALALLLMGMNLQAGVDVVPDRCGFHDITDGAGGEAVAADEHCDIRLCDNQAESDVFFIRFSDPQLGLVGMFDELQGDKLEEILNLVRGLLHAPTMESKG